LRIFLVRHGDADAEVPEALDDGARALTSRARALLPEHFQNLRPLFAKPDVVYMSPLVRAVQTAMLLVEAIRYPGPLRTHRALFPDGPVGAIDALLSAEGDGCVVLVGHQPSMSACAAHLLQLASFPKPVNPGTVIGIEREGAQAKLLVYAPLGQAPTLSLHENA
jgi:phosphohistidine phosphatase